MYGISWGNTIEVSNPFFRRVPSQYKKPLSGLYNPLSKERTVLLYAGETTVTITGEGAGGRNLELAMSLIPELRDDEIIASVASDGHDNTDYAGALVDTKTKQKALEYELDISEYLTNNDSYEFFSQVGDYLMTGKTGSNVSDFVIALKI